MSLEPQSSCQSHCWFLSPKKVWKPENITKQKYPKAKNYVQHLLHVHHHLQTLHIQWECGTWITTHPEALGSDSTLHGNQDLQCLPRAYNRRQTTLSLTTRTNSSLTPGFYHSPRKAHTCSAELGARSWFLFSKASLKEVSSGAGLTRGKAISH